MRLIGLALAAAVAACATVASSAPETSWGKAGVSMDQFLIDATACAQIAASVRAPPEVLVQSRITGGGSAVAGSAEASAASNDALLAAAEASRNAQIRADNRARLAAQDQCLRDRSYVQFRLTAEQRRRMNALHEGSAERANYLHQISADPAVLAAQRM